MCGIAGFWGPRAPELIRAMAAIQHHRGPDDEGFHEDDQASLAFRRLSIIDLAGGRQPMATADGAITLVYNGEVYNYRELRDQLRAAGHRFSTDCDTESVLHAYEEWGESCFARLNGMWAVAILDRRGSTPRLVLARDHFGIKPLYWTRSGERVLFGSEAKALFQDPSVVPRPDDRVLHQYLMTGIHDHSPATFFAGVNQLPAAHTMVVDQAGVHDPVAYWTPRLSTDGDPSPERFRELFLRSVERRLVADVPVGTCLSGGLDSSSIVCAMQQLLEAHVPDAHSMGDRLKTFSALFDGDPIDERRYIDIVLRATGAASTEIRPTSERFYDELEEFVWHVEEPMISTGPYAQWCVQRVAAEQVTVLLDGQGGDELLAGYVPYQYHWLRQLLRERRIGEFLREAWLSRDVLLPLVRRRLGERRKDVPPSAYLRDSFRRAAGPATDARTHDDLKLRLVQDLLTYSLPSALRYEDRNSMAHSLEARLPFLDQELVDWVLTLPPAAIVHNGWSRWILREGLRGLIPEQIRRRRWKVGFTTPEMRWHMARRVILQSLFRSPMFCNRPYWDGLRIADDWKRACDGEIDTSLFFWRVINAEIWLRVFIDDDSRTRRRGQPAPSFAEVGDRAAVELAGTPDAVAAFTSMRPIKGRHLFALAPDRTIVARAALTAPLIGRGDDLEGALREALQQLSGEHVGLRPGDLVAVSEKVVAITQGRSLPVAEIRTTALARGLSAFVRRTPIGIGLGIPATMQLAIEEVGARRILLAAAASAVTRPLGRRGVFYRVAGPQVAAIDGPTPHTLPPYNTHAKKAPIDPDGVGDRLAASLSGIAGGRVEVAIVDINDLGGQVLGSSSGVDRARLIALLRDNPLGQEGQQTPFILLRDVGRLAA